MIKHRPIISFRKLEIRTRIYSEIHAYDGVSTTADYHWSRVKVSVSKFLDLFSGTGHFHYRKLLSVYDPFYFSRGYVSVLLSK
jgi:hypothetical protein